MTSLPAAPPRPRAPFAPDGDLAPSQTEAVPTATAPSTPEDRVDAHVRRILEADDVPAFSKVMRDLMAIIGKEETSAQRLANLVLRDYALTVKVIRAANSAHYNRTGRPVQSATHALMLLGARTVRDLASGLLLFEQYRRRSPGLKELMLLSLLTASHARLTAERQAGIDPETAHVCGMFRNLGEVLVAAHLPDDYAAILRRLEEKAPAKRADAGARATAAHAVLGCAFEDIGVAVARHWGMPDVVRHSMRAAGAPGEEAPSALAAFAHALTDAMHRDDPAAAPVAVAAVIDRHGPRFRLTRETVKGVADEAIRETGEVFAAAGVRLDDLRLTRQVSAALADAKDEAKPGRSALAASGSGAAAATGTRPEAPAVPELRERLVPEVEVAAADPAGYDAARLLLIALEAALRGGPFDRVCFCAANAAVGEFRARTGLGAGVDTLLAAPPLAFDTPGSAVGPALCRGEEVQLAQGARLTMADAQLLRRWEAAGVALFPVTIDGAVIGYLHADRRYPPAVLDAAALAYVRRIVAAVASGLLLRRGTGGGAGTGATPPAAVAAVAPAAAPVIPTRAYALPAAIESGGEADAIERKMDAVLRVLRGEPLDTVAAAAGVDAELLAAWRDQFLSGAAARLGTA